MGRAYGTAPLQELRHEARVARTRHRPSEPAGGAAVSDERFILAPAAVILDRRLTLIETRVLLALLSFRASRTDNTVWPHRDKLMARCGYNAANVSRAITGLVEKGWLSRRQHRGPNTYEIHTPETVAGSEAVSDPETVAETETVSGSEGNRIRSGQETVSDPDTPEETKYYGTRARGGAEGKQGHPHPARLAALRARADLGRGSGHDP